MKQELFMTVTNKLATQVLQKAFENSQTQNTPLAQGQSQFQDMLQNAQETFDFAEMAGLGGNQLVPDGQVQAMSADAIPFQVSDGAGVAFQPGGGDKFVDMLSRFNEQQNHMDHLVNEILYGAKNFSNQELMAIQAHVFHVAQMTEMTVKAAELTVSSFKGVMNTQIQ